MNVELIVPGVPEPKGSKHLRRFGTKVWMMDGSSGKAHRKLEEWAFRVKTGAERTARAHGVEACDGPIGADVTFYMPRPKSAAKRSVRKDAAALLKRALETGTEALLSCDECVRLIRANPKYFNINTLIKEQKPKSLFLPSYAESITQTDVPNRHINTPLPDELTAAAMSKLETRPDAASKSSSNTGLLWPKNSDARSSPESQSIILTGLGTTTAPKTLNSGYPRHVMGNAQPKSNVRTAGNHTCSFFSLSYTRLHCAVKPDLDKLFRGVFDSLKGVLISDDSRIVSLSGRKVYADDESPPGALIRVWSVGE